MVTDLPDPIPRRCIANEFAFCGLALRHLGDQITRPLQRLLNALTTTKENQ